MLLKELQRGSAAFACHGHLRGEKIPGSAEIELATAGAALLSPTVSLLRTVTAG